MEWNIYKEWLDINLYRQMVSMIYQSSSREDKMNFMRKEKENDLFYGAYKQSLEEEYGLYYPDEVLERINAHRSMTKPVYRALGLALAKSDYLQEKCMFNGTQKSRFWKQFGKVLGKKDLCCISVGCLLSEKDRKSWFDELYAYPYEKVEEMVFILSVFPEDITLWQLLKGKVAACLGSRRTISVYEDWPVYAWVTGKYDKRLKNDRTKDVAVLKRLMKLSRINAENANGILIGQLEKSGYTKEEVIFLNGVLTRSESGLGQLDQESLTAEKIAVNVLKTFLPGKEPYPDAVYKLCKTLLCQYDLLPVRIDGNEKIQQCLYECLNVENVKTFLALFPFRKNGLKKWHYIDLNKKEWECLAGQLDEEARQIAEAVLPLMESGFQKEQLHKKYMTAEELQNYEKQKNWKSEQKKRMERWKKEKELKKSFNHIVRKNTDTDQIFKALYSYYAYGRFDGISMRAKMVLGYMRDVLKRKGKIVTDKQEIEYLMELIQKLYADGQLELDGVRKIFDRMEAA